MPVFKIYNSQIFDYVLALEQAHRSGVPVAVRNTLNRAAFDVKQVTMPYETDSTFIKRKPTFFKATSTVNPAVGLRTGNMKAEVGFLAPDNKKESGHATKDLEEQEYGGNIDKRAFIATKEGRSGAGNVKDSLTMAAIKKHIIDANKERGKSSGEKFIKAAIRVGFGGGGLGGFVLGTGRNSKGSRALLKILSIKRTGRHTVVKTQQIYNVKGKRKAHVKPTHFMEKSADLSTAKMNAYFVEESERFFTRMQVKKSFPAITK